MALTDEERFRYDEERYLREISVLRLKLDQARKNKEDLRESILKMFRFGGLMHFVLGHYEPDNVFIERILNEFNQELDQIFEGRV